MSQRVVGEVGGKVGGCERAGVGGGNEDERLPLFQERRCFHSLLRRVLTCLIVQARLMVGSLAAAPLLCQRPPVASGIRNGATHATSRD
jgi:hypothetical protein